MERRKGNGIYALIGAAAVVVVAVLVGALYWTAPRSSQTSTQADVPAHSASLEGKPLEGKSEEQPLPPIQTKTDNPSSSATAPKQPVDGKPLNDKPVQAASGPAMDAPGGKEEGNEASGQAQPSAEQAPQRQSKPEEGTVGEGAPARQVAAQQNASESGAEKRGDGRAAVETPAVANNAGKPDDKAVYPTFDLVRIEPNGENVFAARVAPGATVEMVRDGDVYARAVADTSGLIVIVAPPLPVGASHIYLQSIAPDGRREISKESVTVMIGRDKTRRPLVALASPDKPTVVLSNPDNPDGRKAENGDAAQVENGGKPVASRPDIRIMSVEARDGGRLFVSGLAAPGASVKLYLNGTMVAPGGADSEGRLSFSIARGMVAGNYQVRLDDVDPVSGHVKSKAEVHFKIPEEIGRQSVANDDERPAEGRAASGPLQSHVAIPSIETATVARGDSLWRISERRYGTGYLYLEIYDANLRKIRDPDMIFPGQVLVLPPLEGIPDRPEK